VVTVAAVVGKPPRRDPQLSYDQHSVELADSDFCNDGSWHPDTASHAEACENLLARLVDRITEPPAQVLDVACRKGATTGRPAERFPDSGVVGVIRSEVQVQVQVQAARSRHYLLVAALRPVWGGGAVHRREPDSRGSVRSP
jgi:cyclopropane fatty-acyl-phospholipid synthase-like methyltransferase